MTNKRMIDVDTAARADGKVPVWDTASGTHVYVAASGSVAADTIWDAAGDLVQGTGANTAAKLSAGTAGMFLKSAGAAAANLWAYPPGYEFDYVEATSGVSPTATTEDTANTVITANAKAYDGSTIIIVQFYAFSVRPDSTAARQLFIYLYDDTGGGAASIGRLALIVSPAAAGDNKPVLVTRRLTPSNATHTYSIRAAVNAGTGNIGAGAGGHAADMPMYIRQIKV